MGAAVRVRPLDVEREAEALLELVDALADYEQLPRPEPAARERLVADARRQPPRFEALLAEVDGAVVGYAAFYMTYSTFLALPTLHLEDIFVRPEARGQGAGLALFRACAQEAVRRGCGRMEWQVLDWNTPAQGFYARQGARAHSEWVLHRLDAAALARLAGEEPASHPGSSGGV